MDESDEPEHVEVSYILVEDNEDLTPHGFLEEWEYILKSLDKSRQASADNMRLQIVVMPEYVPSETVSKYSFEKVGGMHTGWYKPKDWPELFEAGNEIVAMLAQRGWDIREMRLQGTYEKPQKRFKREIK